MTISAVVLDVDGTVATCPYDFGAMRAAIAVIAARFHVATSTLGVRGILEQIARVTQLLGPEGEAFRHEAEAAVRAIEVAAARGASLLPGAAAALQSLQADGLAVALITRNCREAARIVLDGFPCYDALLTREDVPKAKPDPDHVLRALTAVARRAEEAAVAGDHAFDMQAGRDAGAGVCIGVRTGNSSDESLLSAGAMVVLDSIAELPAWLRSFRREER